jgi:hypothetical protein
MKLEINYSRTVQLQKAITQLTAERENLRFEVHKLDVQLESLLAEFTALGNVIERTDSDERGRCASQAITTLVTQ